ncbi:7766_t:CDS:1, partial [Cetraspora pellucida]
MYPNCVAVFAFDNSNNHDAFAKDALVVSRMNFKPKGNQFKMRKTYMQNEEQQEIVFSDRTPKGMRKVLEER